MPLLGIFSKKSNPRSKSSATASNTGHSASNISLDDDDYVSVASPNTHQQPTSSSSRIAGLPFRRRPEETHDQQSHTSHLDPLLEPPPRRSSLFQQYQDEPIALRSTQSLPDNADGRATRPQAHPQQVLSSSFSSTYAVPKKSIFSWKSSKQRSKSAPSDKHPSEDSSFNLKSFRHVRPESPSSLRSSSSVQPPIPTPTPTSTMPSSPVSFQVTSRRPRVNSTSDDLSVSPSQQNVTSQQKMAVGVFRQAARRSSTSLTLTDSPVLSPVSPTRSSLDDRPPPSLLPPTQIRTSAPTRPARPQPPPAVLKTVSGVPASKPPRMRTNAFSNSSSSSSSEEDEDEDSDSTDNGAGLSRKTTIKSRAGTLPPVSSTIREQIQRATPPTNPSAQLMSGVHDPGKRPRASLSVGAITPSAQEARASVASAANARILNSPRSPPKPAPAPVLKRGAGSDTSESESDEDSDEDAPLSSLVAPRRPGTAMSTHSSPGAQRKPLVDLDAPSTLTGRPVRAPPPISTEEVTRPKSRASADSSSRPGSKDSRSTPQSQRISQAASNSRLSQAKASGGSRTSQSQGPKISPVTQSSSRISSQQTPRVSQGRLLTGVDMHLSPSGAAVSNTSSPSVMPPMRPFARRESPASSTGDSSSGKAPLTPRDGSDLGGGRSMYSGSANRSRHDHGRKTSVTFEDEQGGRKEKSREKDSSTPQEMRLRDRRRNEARAAIELGNVVNGPPPVDEDDVAIGQQQGMRASWAQQGTQIPVPPMPPMFNMGMNMSMPSPSPFGFGTPSPGDAAYLAAHQQAMAIAKQTFQYAVAQQALAAANEEWERSSNAGAQWGGSQWGGGSTYGLGMPMGMGMRGSTMFPPAPRSMYAGSIGGSAGGGAAWGGAESVYGGSFGPARQSAMYSQGDLSAMQQQEQHSQRPVRPRTKTAPSGTAPAIGAGMGRMPPAAPPSSFRGVGR